MQKIIMIVGLPGSGKTTYLKEHESEFGNVLICDDYYKSAPGRVVRFNGSVYYNEVKSALEKGRSIVIADMVFCEEELRKEMEEGLTTLIAELNIDAEVEYRFFENVPEACIANILHRNRTSRVESELKFIAEHRQSYIIPEGATILPIHQAK